MPTPAIRLVADGAAEHRQALEALHALGCAIPECWRPRGDLGTRHGDKRYWVTSRDLSDPLGFGLRVSRSRRVPWARIVRVEHLGDPLLAERADETARLVKEAVESLGQVMRLEIRLFHREPAIRDTLAHALEREGVSLARRGLLYRLTNVVDLRSPAEELLAALPAAARKGIREPLNKGLVLGSAITGADVPRLLRLMQAAFSRTDGRLQSEVAEQDLQLAIADPAFRPIATLERPDRSGPDRIAAFALGTHNGDHVTYSHGAAERDGGLGRLPLGYAPVWALMQWGVEHGARWFDLGGIAPTDDPNHPLAGITEFKRRFGGADLEVASEMQLVLSDVNARIEKLVGQWLPKTLLHAGKAAALP